MRLVDRQALRLAERGRGAGVDDPAHARVPAGAEQPHRAQDVGGRVALGLRQRAHVAHLRRQMEDIVRARHQLSELGQRTEITGDHGQPIGSRQVLPLARREVVDHGDFTAGREQDTGQIAPNEACPAGDQAPRGGKRPREVF